MPMVSSVHVLGIQRNFNTILPISSEGEVDASGASRSQKTSVINLSRISADDMTGLLKRRNMHIIPYSTTVLPFCPLLACSSLPRVCNVFPVVWADARYMELKIF